MSQATSLVGQVRLALLSFAGLTPSENVLESQRPESLELADQYMDRIEIDWNALMAQLGEAECRKVEEIATAMAARDRLTALPPGIRPGPERLEQIAKAEEQLGLKRAGTPEKLLIAADILRALQKWRSPAEQLRWREAYRCESELVPILPLPVLRNRVERYLDDMRRRLPELAPVHERIAADIAKDWEKIAATSSGGASGGQAEADALEVRERAAAAALVREVLWESTKRNQRGRIAGLYASRLVVLFICFFVVIAGFSLILINLKLGGRMDNGVTVLDNGFAGALIAVIAGLFGASFSLLIKQNDTVVSTGFEELRTRIGNPMLILRFCVGAISAAVIYFLFNSGLIETSFFPDTAKLGFQPIVYAREPIEPGTLPVAARAEVGDLLDKAKADLGGAEGTDIGPILAQLTTIQQKVIAMQPDRNGPLLGSSVPNRELSLLVIWCFLAGFAERLIPELLNRIEQEKAGAKAKTS